MSLLGVYNRTRNYYNYDCIHVFGRCYKYMMGFILFVSQYYNYDIIPAVSSSESMSSSGCCCPNVLAKAMPVLRHCTCCCHPTEYICDVLLPLLSWLSSASFPCHPLALLSSPNHVVFRSLLQLRQQYQFSPRQYPCRPARWLLVPQSFGHP